MIEEARKYVQMLPNWIEPDLILSCRRFLDAKIGVVKKEDEGSAASSGEKELPLNQTIVPQSSIPKPSETPSEALKDKEKEKEQKQEVEQTNKKEEEPVKIEETKEEIQVEAVAEESPEVKRKLALEAATRRLRQSQEATAVKAD
jgi:hypothetical protein